MRNFSFTTATLNNNNDKNYSLSINVIKERRSKKVAYGDGGDGSPLQKKIRAHANFTEYTPLALILIGALEASAALPRAAVAALAAAFLLARALHASNMGYGGAFANRVRGTGGTFVSLAALSACNLYAAARTL